MVIDVREGGSLPCLFWEIYYKDNTIVSSADMDWADAPTDGVLGVIWWHEYHMEGVRKKTYSLGLDYYVYVDENKWGDTNDFNQVKDFSYKRGIWTTDEHMEQVRKTMHEKLDVNV